MRKIKRKLSGQEKQLQLATHIFQTFDSYIVEKNLADDFKSWLAEKEKGGDNNGLQGKQEDGESGRKEGENDNSCCGKGSCCKEGKEVVV